MKIRIKSAAEIEKMRVSGRIAAAILKELSGRVSPGITTGELDAVAAGLIRDAGAKSAFLGYRGYPGNVCISVNEEVVHGVPGGREVAVGDIVSLDVGIRYGGFIGDTACTVMVGVSDIDVMRLVSATEAALAAGIDVARAGNRLSDISHAVQKVVEAGGFSVVRDFVGHGVGFEMHEEPQIPNFGKPGRGPVLAEGMTLAIEPMVNLGKAAVEVLADGWTVVTRDRKPSAHSEHTVVVRSGREAEILTGR